MHLAKNRRFSKNMKIETARLVIEPVRDADFEDFLRINSDAETMKYIRTVEPREQIQARFDKVKKYAADNPGFGSMRISDRETGAFLGHGIVRHADFQPGRDIEIGYVLEIKNWGKGIGTEVANALAEYVLTVLGAPKVVAYISAENAKSERVLTKCGFRKVGQEEIYGDICLLLEKVKL